MNSQNNLLKVMNTKKQFLFIRTVPIILFIFMRAFAIMTSSAAPVDSIFAEANRHYMNLAYSEAAILYQSAIDTGYESPELYYNLGNTYYKLNQLAEAILYYEKARKLAPLDEDVRNNLEMANARIVDEVEIIPDFFLKRWWKFVINMLPPDVWAITSLLLLIIALFCYYLFMLAASREKARKHFLVTAAFILLMSVFLYVSSICRKNGVVNTNTAIILDFSVTVKSSPEELGTNVFVLHEGTKVEILDRLEGWREIKIANGNKGWVKNSSIGEI